MNTVAADVPPAKIAHILDANAQTSRRAMLGALVVAPLALSAPVSAAGIASTDVRIEAAWQERVQVYAAMRALPINAGPVNDIYVPGEAELCSVIDGAEEVIRTSVRSSRMAGGFGITRSYYAKGKATSRVGLTDFIYCHESRPRLYGVGRECVI